MDVIRFCSMHLPVKHLQVAFLGLLRHQIREPNDGLETREKACEEVNSHRGCGPGQAHEEEQKAALLTDGAALAASGGRRAVHERG